MPFKWIFIPAASTPPSEPEVSKGQYWKNGKPFMKVRQSGITLGEIQKGVFWKDGKTYAVNGI